MEKINQIKHAMKLLNEVRACQNKVDKLTEKTLCMSPQNSTQKSIQREHTNLNWACMHLDKAKTDFARYFKGSLLDVSIESKDYNPSGFHSYKH